MLPAPLPNEFYARPTQTVACELIGCFLVRRIGRAIVGGRIVETEAYLPTGDSASHGARGKNRKNASMFGPPGRAYIYPIHAKWCFNVVTDRDGVPAAVLIRAIEPLWGVPRMIAHRGRAVQGRDIASGPARLCQALLIDRRLDGWDLTRGRTLWIARGVQAASRRRIARTPRIGVTSAEDLLLRFIWRDHAFLSQRR